jgi:hypothetical protein
VERANTIVFAIHTNSPLEQIFFEEMPQKDRKAVILDSPQKQR